MDLRGYAGYEYKYNCIKGWDNRHYTWKSTMEHHINQVIFCGSDKKIVELDNIIWIVFIKWIMSQSAKNRNQ